MTDHRAPVDSEPPDADTPASTPPIPGAPFSVRPGRATDAEAVHALIQPFVKRDLLLDRTVDEIGALTGCSVAAECEGRLVGFAAVEVYSKKLAEVQCLAVDGAFHDRGIGKALIAGCVKLAAKQNVLELMAISSSDDFLKSCGFDYSLPGQKRALFMHPRSVDD